MDILDVQKIVLSSECEEVREERVEVALGLQMEHGGVVRVVEMREYAEELTVDVLRRSGEGLRELNADFGGEVPGVIDSLLNPGHNVVDIRGSRELYLFPVLINPSIVEHGAGRHSRTRMGST